MATRRPSVFKTEILICARKYSIIDASGNSLLAEVSIPLMTEDGFFAAPIPEGIDHDEFRKYEGCELHELPFEKEDTFRAGRIEKCTSNGFYGRFYKDCILRAKKEREFYYTIRSSRWIDLVPVGLWSYNYPSCPRIQKGEITSLPDKQKAFAVTCPKQSADNEMFGAIVMLGWYIVGVVTGTENSDKKELRCISAETLLREMCQHKEKIEVAIANGLLPIEKEPDFIIHSGVLEKYQGNAETVVVPDGVHTIGEKAFCDNWAVRHVHLPESVKRIEWHAFNGCLLLQTIKLSKHLKSIGPCAFDMCRSLKAVELPNSVTEIGRYAFSDCRNLMSVRLPEKLKCIEDNTFSDCAVLTSVVIPDSVKSIGDFAFQNCKKLRDIQLPASVQAGWDSFEGTPWLRKYLRKNGALILGNKVLAVYEKLTEYEIPETVTCIGKFAFSYSNIETLKLPKNVSKIESYAFSSSELKHIHLPRKLKKIGDMAFAGCHRLEELTIPKSVDDIGGGAFHDLPNCVVTILNDDEDAELISEDMFSWCNREPCVKEVRVPFGSKAMRAARLWNLPCTYLDGTPRRYSYIEEDFCCEGTTLVKYLGHSRIVHVPAGITVIGDYAFADHHGGVEKIILPSSVHTIGRGAFIRCESLKEITGTGVTEIKTSAFFRATGLEKAVFPSLRNQANDAFEQCESLTETGLIISEVTETEGN